MILSCPNYLHADVSDGEDLSGHQTGGQLVTMSLVPSPVDSNVASECHLCCPPPLPTEEVSSLDGSWVLCASRLIWKKEKRKVPLACQCMFPLTKRTEWGPGRENRHSIQRLHFFHGWGGVGYFLNERGFSVESSLQRISSIFLLCKQKDSSVVL